MLLDIKTGESIANRLSAPSGTATFGVTTLMLCGNVMTSFNTSQD